jgi:hypothetical protein
MKKYLLIPLVILVVVGVYYFSGASSLANNTANSPLAKASQGVSTAASSQKTSVGSAVKIANTMPSPSNRTRTS